ncbi:MAG: hypothetical protein WC850_05315 [Candidatus Gracilibacteria bacterium]
MQQKKIVEIKVCKHCNSSFDITDKDLEFYDKISPIFNGVKYNIPSPTLCPDCRQQRRLSLRNERKLYKRKCDFSGKDIVSIYSPDKPYKVYGQEIWLGDKWNPLEYGKDFNFGKTFFKQFEELNNNVPKLSIRTMPDMENCQYCNNGFGSKSCYMCCTPINSENCYYTHTSINCYNDIDGLFNVGNQFCYNSVQSNENYNCSFIFYSHNCKNSFFLNDCVNCEDCFGCVNLNNKKYCFLNEQLNQEEYQNKISTIEINQFKENFNKFAENFPKPYTRGTNFSNCTGDFIVNCDNCLNSFGIIDLKDSNYCYNVGIGSENIYDCVHVGPANNCLESATIAGTTNSLFSLDTKDSYNVFYCHSCSNVKNCFGCFGIRDKSYCILNKQYTKEEYEKLVPKIIEHMKKTGEWGEFFPSSISPFGYNETVANEYFSLTKENALKKGFKWSDYESPFPKVKKIIPASKLPDNISQIPDDILNWAIECEVTKKPFRIIKQELDFYRKHNLPIPKRHPDQRHLDRMALRNPRKLFDRKCDKCGKDIKTTYSSERLEIVYCEDCYNKEVY